MLLEYGMLHNAKEGATPLIYGEVLGAFGRGVERCGGLRSQK